MAELESGSGLVNTTVAGDQIQPQVAALANGGWVAVWTSGSGFPRDGVFAQVYDAQGRKSGGEIPLFADPQPDRPGWSGYQVGDVAGLPDGTFVVTATAAWIDTAPVNALFLKRFTPSGEMVAGPIQVAAGDHEVRAQGGDIFLTGDGGYAVIESAVTRPVPWSFTDFHAHYYDAQNTPASGRVLLDGPSDSFDIAAFAGGARYLVTGWNIGPGPGTVAWGAFDRSGSLLGAQVFQGSFASVNHAYPIVSGLADGRAIVVWSEYASTQSTWQARFVDPAGQPQGDVFTLALTPPAGGMLRITALADGAFLATWPRPGDWDADGTTLLGQAFDASGRTVGAVMDLGNVARNSSHEVLTSADGGFVVVAEVLDASMGHDIQARKFSAPVPVAGMVITGGDAADNLAGAAGHDVIGGGPGNDSLHGGQGDDWLDGGAGIDTAVFTFGIHDYKRVSGPSGWTVAGAEGTDTLVGIERLKFSDFSVALDVDGHGGMAWRLYRAAFDRAPDLPGLGYHLRNLDDGVPLSTVGAHFIASPEFQSMYGVLDDTQFITQLYANVLHRAPDPGGLLYHLDEFARGDSRADMLIHFSESPENQAAVLMGIRDGMLYTEV